MTSATAARITPFVALFLRTPGPPWGSLALFAVTGVIYLAQTIPSIGVGLMLFGAPAWSILTVNGAFVGLAFEAICGRTWRVLILAPMLYVVGYGAYAVSGHVQLAAIVRDVAAANAGQRIAFDPDVQAILADHDVAKVLVRDYGLDIAYSPTGSRQSGYRATRLADIPTCQRVRRDPAMLAAGVIDTGDLADMSRNDGTPPHAIGCFLSAPETPSKPLVTITTTSHPFEQGLVRGELESLTIRAPGQAPVTVKSGSARAPSWFPMPIMGCVLNDLGPSWRCAAEFASGGRKWFSHGPDTREAVAAALGLRRHPPTPKASPRLAAQLAEAADEEVELEVLQLGTLLKDPSASQGNIPSMRALAEAPQAIAPYADAMASAFAQGLTSDGDARVAHALMAPLGALPDADLARVAPKIMAAATASNPWFTPYRANMGSLMTRLSVAGPPAIPFLIENAEPRANGSVSALQGLCRLGPAAADAAAPTLAAILADPKGDIGVQGRQVAAFTALMRMGRRDLALSNWPRSRDKRELDLAFATVSPASPISVCTPRPLPGDGA